LAQALHGQNTVNNVNQSAGAGIADTRCAALTGRHCMVMLPFAFGMSAARSQVIVERTPVAVTFEAYGNTTVGTTVDANSASGDSAEPIRFDGAARALARISTAQGPDIGLRVVVETTSTGEQLAITEASVLLFGSAGRLEIGKRMGLPDVLTGYAPNSFTFTVAEFGPPTGLTLDPGGGLQTQFLPADARARVEPLAARGVTASLFNDESWKVLYVVPKYKGWLAGVSFSPDADDPRFGQLLQGGLVHESYSHQDIWRWGGTYAHARASTQGAATGATNLDSLSAGTSVTLHDSLDIGVAGSYDGHTTSGSPFIGGSSGTAWGATASLNYNSGPWTLGGYYQISRAPAVGGRAGNDRLSAGEIGASYRFTTRLRLYGAWFVEHLVNDRYGSDPVTGTNNVVTVGLRATL
jgi:hypothetical protein